jgi:hypothetical protein
MILGLRAVTRGLHQLADLLRAVGRVVDGERGGIEPLIRVDA